MTLGEGLKSNGSLIRINSIYFHWLFFINLEENIFNEFEDFELLTKLGFTQEEFVRLSFTESEINFVSYIKNARNTSEEIQEGEENE